MSIMASRLSACTGKAQRMSGTLEHAAELSRAIARLSRDTTGTWMDTHDENLASGQLSRVSDMLNRTDALLAESGMLRDLLEAEISAIQDEMEGARR